MRKLSTFILNKHQANLLPRNKAISDQKLTMLIEERFTSTNSVSFDRKYADKIRVFVKGGDGGNG